MGDNIYMPFTLLRDTVVSPHSTVVGFSGIAMHNWYNMLFPRMRDHQAIDSLLLKELKSCCAQEYNFLPREAGLKLMESASTEVTH